MKTIKKNVYYCDYCKKRGLSASAMSVHEKHCTANPNRKCRLCNNNLDIIPFMRELGHRFELLITEDEYGISTHEVHWIGTPITLQEVLEFTDGCPNCTLAILRQTKLNYSVFGFKYDFKKEMAAYWSEKNNEEFEREMSGYQY